MFGHEVALSSNSAGAVCANVRVGHRYVRPPMFVAQIVSKVANGACAALSEDERQQVELLNIKLAKVTLTDMDRNKIKDDAVRAGKSYEEAAVLAMTATGGWKTTDNVSIEGYFVPA